MKNYLEKYIAKTEIEIKYFKPQEKIVVFNRPLEKLFYLVEGRAKISMIHEDGKVSIVQFLEKGDWIGELTLLEVEDQHKEVVAINPCQCLCISMALAKEVLLKQADFLLSLNQYLGHKLLNRTEFYAKNQSYPLANRLAAYILWSENEGIYHEKHTETAEFLGISYRHLLFTLKDFQEKNLLQKNKKGYQINRGALQVLGKDLIELDKK